MNLFALIGAAVLGMVALYFAFRSKPPAEPWVKCVQVTSGIFQDGHTLEVIELTEGQVPGNCFCRLTMEVVGDDLADNHVTAVVRDADVAWVADVLRNVPDRVELKRANPSGDLKYVLTVIEVLPDQANVQQVVFEVSEQANTETSKITAVDLKRAFVTGYARKSTGVGDCEEEWCLALELNSSAPLMLYLPRWIWQWCTSTHVELTRPPEQRGGALTAVGWVVEATGGGFSVEHRKCIE